VAAMISTSTPVMQGRPPLLTKRWPCMTGLASYLSSYVSITDGRSCFQSALPGRCRIPASLRCLAGCASPSSNAPFRVPLAKRNLMARHSSSGTPPGVASLQRPNPLAHSSNCRSFPITVSVLPTKTQLRKPDSTRGRFLAAPPFPENARCHSPPDSQSQNRSSATSNRGSR